MKCEKLPFGKIHLEQNHKISCSLSWGTSLNMHLDPYKLEEGRETLQRRRQSAEEKIYITYSFLTLNKNKVFTGI